MWEVGHLGKATVSVEEKVYMSDVVVRARLQSVSDGVLTFRNARYLKGEGSRRFTVRANTENRDSQWDNQDALLFLTKLSGESEDFEFTDTTAVNYGTPDMLKPERYTGDLPEGYTLGTRNPVWLPVQPSSNTGTDSVQRNTASNDDATVITDGARGEHESITQSEIQGLIQWTSGPFTAEKAPNIPGFRSGVNRDGNSFRGRAVNDNDDSVSNSSYDDCVVTVLEAIRKQRDAETYAGPLEDYVNRLSLESGAPRGSVVLNYVTAYHYKDTYIDHRIFGPDAHLFKPTIVDENTTARDGYYNHVVSRRPLPAEIYQFRYQEFDWVWDVCGYRGEPRVIQQVTVTAPPGTVHEAFFDPATTTAGVGYSAGTATSTGVLEPAGFSVRGRAITITGLTWQNGRVVLTLDRFGSWLDGFSFIEPDGTVGLRLAEVDATKDWAARTLTWEVSEQPWESGDELMMRMGPIPLPAVRNLTAEANSDGEVVLRWEVAYRAGVSGYRIWRHRPGRDDGPRIYVSDTLSTDTTFTDEYSPLPNLTEYRVQAIDRIYNAGERSESVRVGGE